MSEIVHKLAKTFVQCFINKINSDRKRYASLKDAKLSSWRFFVDESSRRRNRYGWYGTAKYNTGREIVSSIDVDMSAVSEYKDTDILAYMNILMTDYLLDNSISYISFKEMDEFLEKLYQFDNKYLGFQ